MEIRKLSFDSHEMIAFFFSILTENMKTIINFINKHFDLKMMSKIRNVNICHEKTKTAVKK